MSAQQHVQQGDIVATFHPPAFDDQMRVIDSRVAEAEARIGTLKVRPLEIDGPVLQRPGVPGGHNGVTASPIRGPMSRRAPRSGTRCSA